MRRTYKHKRIISLILSAVLIFGMIPTAFATESAPAETTAETTSPVETTIPVVETTSAAEETTSAAEETTSAAEETTSAAEETTSAAEETTVPETTEDVEETTVPETTVETTVPETTEETVEETTVPETTEEIVEESGVITQTTLNSAGENGTSVSIFGNLPQNAEVSMTQATAAEKAIVDRFGIPFAEPTSGFRAVTHYSAMHNIEIKNDGQNWQPNEPVKVTVNLGCAIPMDAYVEVIHILDNVDAVRAEVALGDYESYTVAGLSEVFPEETAAAMQAGCPENTIVYQIMASSVGEVQHDETSVSFELSSFSNVYITATSLFSGSQIMFANRKTEDNSVELSKRVDKTDAGFELTLEAYATGEEVPAPVDVVFVVDHSTSMFTVADTDTEYNFKNSAGYSYDNFLEFCTSNKDLVAQEGYFVLRINDGATNFRDYHTIYSKDEFDSKKSFSTTSWHIIDQAKGQLQHITSGYSNSKQNDATNDYAVWLAVRWNKAKNRLEYNATALESRVWTSRNNGQIGGIEYWAGDKYWLPVPTARAEALTTTNLRFYQTIYGATHDAMMLFYNQTKNIENCQVAVVGFSEGGGIYGATVKNDYYEDIDLNNGTLTAAQAQDLTSVLPAGYGKNAFSPVGSTDLLAKINNINPNYYGTVTDAGMALANYIFKNPSVTGARPDAKRIVILYTDGNPVGCLEHEYDKGTTHVSNEAIAQAKISKNNYDATVYSIAPVSGVDNVYLSCISSEYPNATSTTNMGIKNPDGVKYAIAATSTDQLKAEFAKLAKTISQTSVSLGTTAVLKDILSDSFALPAGADESAIRVYTSDYDGTAFSDTLVEFDGDVTIEGKDINVSGFNYSENYISALDRDGFYGRKLVVKVPIVAMNPLGGDDVKTNTELSAIYSGGTIVEKFDEPTVDLPTTISFSKVTDDDCTSAFNFDITYSNISIYEDNGKPSGNALNANEETSASITDKAINANGSSFAISDALIGGTLTFTEEPAENYKLDYVEIKYTNASGQEVTEKLTANQNGSFTTTIYAGMQIIVHNQRLIADLTITKAVADAADLAKDKGVSFLFQLEGTSDKTLGVKQILVINETGSITVKDLPVGNYKITELEGWSWRYEVSAISAEKDTDEVVDLLNGIIDFELTFEGENVTFTNDREQDKWLDGDTYCENTFNKK